MVSCQQGPTRNAYAWQIGPFWQDIIELLGLLHKKVTVKDFSKIGHYQTTTTKRKNLCMLEAWNTELEEIFGYPDKEG